jgi:hypothetical protein
VNPDSPEAEAWIAQMAAWLDAHMPHRHPHKLGYGAFKACDHAEALRMNRERDAASRPASAQAIRRLLREKLDVRASYVRSRQGFRVHEIGLGYVRVSADLDSDAEATRAADAIEAVLRAAGYAVDREPDANGMLAKRA